MANQNGFYRAKVVDNKDPNDCGQIKVWIPDLMQKIPESKGLMASPGNNPMGGLNLDGDSSHHYMGSSYIPAIGSWIWIFFENGKNDRPYYFAALDIENSKVLPENRLGSNKSKKWVLFKSNEGRTIVVSDDTSDCRVEITGKKRQLSDPPSGDTSSVYTIDGNQTTILLDERDGQEKLLIRTHKGDFVNIDITNRKLNIQFESDITIESKASIYIKAATHINIDAGGNINSTSASDINNLASGNINSDGSAINDQCGIATAAGSLAPIGTR